MELKNSILQTIAFFDLFDFPLAAEEIKEELYRYPKPVHIKEVKGVLEEMEGVTERILDHYVLKGRGAILETRKARKFISEKWWGRVRQYGQYLVQVPFVEMVAVCNNLAYDNATEQSDIDLFIVVRKGRLWMARLIITLIAQFFGIRRHGHKIAGRFCLSFFVTSEKLGLEGVQMKPEDPYLAYWAKSLRPIYGKETYRQFVEANQGWLQRGYGIKLDDEKAERIPFPTARNLKKFREWLWGGSLGNGMEALIRRVWKPRTEKHAQALGAEASVVIAEDMLKFHNHDRRKEYFEEWQKRVGQAMENLEKREEEKLSSSPDQPPLENR